MTKKYSILIACTCIPNNGDALLVFGLAYKLRQKGHSVHFSSKVNKTLCQKLYPQEKWENDLQLFSIPEKYIISRFPGSKNKLIKAKARWRWLRNRYDLIIAAPGGYINQFYGFHDELYSLICQKKIHKAKLVMYSQSVGPLYDWQIKDLNEYIKYFNLFMVRDNYSYSFVSEFPNVLLTNDAAYLNKPKRCNHKASDTIAVSVRTWNRDGRSERKYIELIKALITLCIDKGYNIEFISTCQGDISYINDSEMAKKILKCFPKSYQTNIKINAVSYSIQQLQQRIKKYRFVIGTRLHMCILSILNGIPAFNISYEKKGSECFMQLGIQQYSIDYNEPIETAVFKLENFLDTLSDLDALVYKKASEMHKNANHYFNIFEETFLRS